MLKPVILIIRQLTSLLSDILCTLLGRSYPLSSLCWYSNNVSGETMPCFWISFMFVWWSLGASVSTLWNIISCSNSWTHSYTKSLFWSYTLLTFLLIQILLCLDTFTVPENIRICFVFPILVYIKHYVTKTSTKNVKHYTPLWLYNCKQLHCVNTRIDLINHCYNAG